MRKCRPVTERGVIDAIPSDAAKLGPRARSPGVGLLFLSPSLRKIAEIWPCRNRAAFCKMEFWHVAGIGVIGASLFPIGGNAEVSPSNRARRYCHQS